MDKGDGECVTCVAWGLESNHWTHEEIIFHILEPHAFHEKKFKKVLKGETYYKGALIKRRTIQPFIMVKYGQKKNAPECPVECRVGWGVQSLFG